MKAKNIAYSVTTAHTAAAFALGGFVDIGRGEEVVEGMAHLGYPVYVATILGIWKILGALAIVVPGLPLLKEWAYAGMLFDLTGASASHAFSGDGIGNIVTPLIMLVVVAALWSLRASSRRLTARPCAPATLPNTDIAWISKPKLSMPFDTKRIVYGGFEVLVEA